MKRMAVAVLLFAMVAAPSLAERVLLPVIIPYGPSAGAQGSLWTTEWLIANSGATQVAVDFPAVCPADACPPPLRLNPGEFATPKYVALHIWGDGVFADISGGTAAMHLRVQDVSRQALTWGTEVPIVGEDALRAGRVDLAAVPAETAFRPMLRIYDFDAHPESRVRVRIFTFETNELLVDGEVRLISPGTQFPGYARYTAFPEVPEGTRVRIRIDALTPDLRLWAFVSITNNETQHVTLVTPQ